jgi:sulfate adenylyltransferase subunit 1
MALDRDNIDLLKFSVIGSVDDGKSTLIGRLLYDSKSIFEDQLQAIEESSKRRGEDRVNLALLTDGLKDEREQGITIDVAYRYFATPKRKFIIADCPGHIQYTRNMVTGTSSASACVILIDARNGVVEQTKRHAFITSMMGVKHLVVCVNKMDLENYSQETYDKICEDFKSFLTKLEIPEVHFIPISALNGDNVVDRSENMDWYQGSSLLYLLENLHLGSDDNHIDCRFPVQRVIRPQDDNWHDFRGYAGQVASGVFKPGDSVTVLPSGFESKIDKIWKMNEEVAEAYYPMSVVITLKDDLDLSRGGMIVRQNNQPEVSQDLDLLCCWLSEKDFSPNSRFVIRHSTNEVKGKIKEVLYKIDIQSLHRDTENKTIKMNDLFRVRLRTNKPIFVDPYRQNRSTGSLVLIDEQNNNTVAACLVSH